MKPSIRFIVGTIPVTKDTVKKSIRGTYELCIGYQSQIAEMKAVAPAVCMPLKTPIS